MYVWAFNDSTSSYSVSSDGCDGGHLMPHLQVSHAARSVVLLNYSVYFCQSVMTELQRTHCTSFPLTTLVMATRERRCLVLFVLASSGVLCFATYVCVQHLACPQSVHRFLFQPYTKEMCVTVDNRWHRFFHVVTEISYLLLCKALPCLG